MNEGMAHRDRGGPSWLAYVFWHWRRGEVEATEYEERQRAFHRALCSDAPPGFHGSFSVGVSGVPWAAGGGEAYEDWYLVEGFEALGTLNEAAVSATRAEPHDAAAAVASGGTGGLYRLEAGAVARNPGHACWLSKPEGMDYGELFSALQPLVAGGDGAIWQRQLVLGPAPEVCLQTPGPLTLRSAFDPLALSFRSVWPGPNT